MDDRHAATGVWMRILICHAAMRCPSGVPNTAECLLLPVLGILPLTHRAELRHLARTLHNLNLSTLAHQRHPRAVIAAVLERLERPQYHILHISMPCITNNSTHVFLLIFQGCQEKQCHFLTALIYQSYDSLFYNYSEQAQKIIFI